MIGIAIPLGLSVPAGALFGTNLFFTTGLPGAISYSLLFAERNQLLDKPIVQKYNALVHTWIRAPGCLAHAALTTALALSSQGLLLQQAIVLLVAMLTAWNGLYFMEQAIVTHALNRIAPVVQAHESTHHDATNDDRRAPAHVSRYAR